MRPTRLFGTTLAAALLLVAGPAAAQEEPTCWLTDGTTAEQAAERASPRDSAAIDLSAGMAKICYGAPSARGRDIMGGLVPYDQPWRGGADEATALHLTFPAEVAGVSVEPGTYSLYFTPGQGSWTVHVNEEAQRWGIPINAGVMENDIGSATVQPTETDGMVEQMRYRFEETGPNEAHLILEWENTRIEIPVEAASG